MPSSGENSAIQFRGFLRASRESARAILRERGDIEESRVWIRVPQWRFLRELFLHENVLETFFIVEHSSADAAGAEDRRELTLDCFLNELWNNYCLQTERESPMLVRVLLPPV